MLRHYKPVATRLRPTDRMVAHTGYLIFARPVTAEVADEYAGEKPAPVGEKPFPANEEPTPDGEESPLEMDLSGE